MIVVFHASPMTRVSCKFWHKCTCNLNPFFFLYHLQLNWALYLMREVTARDVLWKNCAESLKLKATLKIGMFHVAVHLSSHLPI